MRRDEYPVPRAPTAATVMAIVFCSAGGVSAQPRGDAGVAPTPPSTSTTTADAGVPAQATTDASAPGAATPLSPTASPTTTPAAPATTSATTSPTTTTTAPAAAGSSATDPAPPAAGSTAQPAAGTPAANHAAPRAGGAPPGAPGHRAPEQRGFPVQVSAGLGTGVTVRTLDDRFMLTIRARAQARFTLVSQEMDPPGVEFSIRRMRLLFQGHFFTRAWQYYLQLGFSNRDTEPDLRLPLRDAYITFSGVRDLNIRVGQMKVPFDRQRVVSSSSLQMVDRSIVTNELNLDRDVGIQLFSTNLFGAGHILGYQLGVFGGDGRNRLSDAFGFLYVARVQVSPFGQFDDYVEADVERLPRPRLAIGLGGAFNHNSNRARSTLDETYRFSRFDYAHAEADLIFKFAGFSLMAEAIYRAAVGVRCADGATAPQDPGGRVQPSSCAMTTMGTTGPMTTREWSRNFFGYFVQAGYLFTRNFEVSARWGDMYPIAVDPANTDPRQRIQRELGGALSWYFQEHAFKIQADYFYLFGQQFEGGQHQARVQLQLYF